GRDGTKGRGPSLEAGDCSTVVGRAGDEGLDARDYDAADLELTVKDLQRGVLEKAPNARALADLDLRLTYTYFRYAYHLLNGRVPREALDPEWVASAPKIDLGDHLKRSLAAHRVNQGLAELLPSAPHYARLPDALLGCARIAQSGGWPSVPAGPPLRLGSTGSRVTLLARRLAATGDLREGTGARFDRGFETAVRGFQARHGLQATGIVDRATLSAL